MSGDIPGGVAHALQVSLGSATVIRRAGDDILHRALFASAAIPVVFDPVVLPMIDGNDAVYVDGSITSNAAVSIARTIASTVDVLLVDAQSKHTTYPNALAVAVGAYTTMQRNILETAMRDIYFETLAERSHDATFDDLPGVRIRYIRPDETLAPDINAFGDQRVVDAMFERGTRAAHSGFSPYLWQTFHL